jgi:hypothetical protein
MNSQPLEIINRLRLSLSVSTLAELARLLDVSPQAINGAIRKRQIPEAWLYKVAYITGRRVEWLQSGHGHEFSHEEMEKYRRDFPPSIQELREQYGKLSEAERSIVDNAMKLILSSDPQIRALTVEMTERLLEHRKSPLQQLASSTKKKSRNPIKGED